MTEHYYSKNPTSKSNPSQFQTSILSSTFTFHTDEGVFSKKQLDYGTNVLLHAFELPEVEGDLLDLGCGYGPIGIGLAKQYRDREILMVDINERAVELSKKNCEVNAVENARVLQSDGIESVSNQRFATVITNPPFRAGKTVVHQMVEDSYELLLEGGELWVVVQKKQGAPSLKGKIKNVFGQVDVVKRDKGYFILRGKKFDSDIPV
ncbi:class I SAM-dependent methyltransferase [Aquisalibacillus elongatus]|uniref:16S rRNA m(2)G 1207 methyltransferase n=1 Tax=Aquisalibacillus elongatus TaxID=485577 RepID=A0A3N5AXK1_9BACI|nr:class I SAM-dependent methyltransferase [Aquisalibacillus elongatus]RPF49976.1 16S rRNA m(2)G 1207 methyltransferase [Aquisalibacillus elongatus]